MKLNLKGKKALVTGGSHGIGRAIALSLAEEGCNVAICSRTDNRLEKTMKELSRHLSGNVIIGYNFDALKCTDVHRVIKYVGQDWGGVDILINNVGGGGRWGDEDPLKTKPEVWSEVYQKNAGAATQFTMGLLPSMIENNWGRVVTIASMYGKESGGRPWFTMAKAAEIALMKSLSRIYVKDGITFNTVCPGDIQIPDTPFDKSEDPDLPLGRRGTPEEVASLVTYICSNQLINGACITIDGGQTRSF